MRNLTPPTDEDGLPLDAGEVFETCISMVRNTALKSQLRAVRTRVENEAEDYAEKAADSRLYQVTTHNQVGTVSGTEMVKVYTGRMVPKKAKGRPTYDRIMAAPAHGRCPFCGVGTVNTLDHYLPKTRFPVFAVTPNNLVPACQWCQKAKGEYYAEEEGRQLLHPYFDKIDEEIWLAAEVVVGAPAGFRYFVSAPDDWAQTMKDRLEAHLRELNLLTLFSSNAGSRLSEIRSRLNKLYQHGGEEALRAHLHEELASFEDGQKNSWATAMYRAAIASDWFCNGGFRGE